MVFTLRVSLQLRTIEVDLAQFARAVSFGLIVEMRRCRMAALAAGRHGPGANFVAKLDYCNKAVPACAIPFFCSRVSTRSKRRQRAPHGRSESHRNARSCVAERLHDVARQA